MIFVTGDCHGDYTRFSQSNFPQQKEMTRDDIVIICGDFGLWHNTAEERYWLKWLENKSFTVLFCDGNHENFDRLYNAKEFRIEKIHGGKVHRIRENVFRSLRGEMFKLEGKKFFFFGGAKSHDIDDGILDANDYETRVEFNERIRLYNALGKMYRINHISWWKEELPNEYELEHGWDSLKIYGLKTDYIISHCAPASVAAKLGYDDHDILTDYFDEIAKKVKFKDWYFGHYHSTKTVDDKYHLLYHSIVQIM